MLSRFLLLSTRIAAVAHFAVLAACGHDTVAPPTVFGRYDLQTVDAKPLPTLLYEEGDGAIALDSATLLEITRGPDGLAASLTPHQNGASTPGQRVK